MVLRPGDGGDFFGAPGERELPCCVVTKVREAVPEQTAAGFGPIVSQKRKENRLGVFMSVYVHTTLGAFKRGRVLP